MSDELSLEEEYLREIRALKKKVGQLEAELAAERERCAKIAEMSEPCGTCDYHNVPCEIGAWISRKIRA